MMIAVFLAAALTTAAPQTPEEPTPAGPPSAAQLLADPRIDSAQLSPDARKVAYVQRDGDASSVAVYDVQAKTSVIVLHSNSKSLAFDWIRWKSDSRLVAGVTVVDITRADRKNPRSEILAYRYGRYMVGVDPDGGRQVVMFRSVKRGDLKTASRVELLDSLHADPENVLAIAPLYNGAPAVWRANVLTGEATPIEAGDLDTLGWDTDRTGAVVARAEARGQMVELLGRAPGEKDWKTIVKFRRKTFLKQLEDFDVLGGGEEPATLYVAARPKDGEGDVRTIHLFDVRTNTLGPDLWPGLKYDVTGIVVSKTTGALAGVCYQVDALRCDFKDKTVQANMRGLERFLGGDESVSLVSWSEDEKWWLLQASGPDDPGSYYLYDLTHHVADQLVRKNPDIAAGSLATKTPFPFAARDGTPIPAYLSTPPGATAGRPLPLVVMPHGGPMVRDGMDFDVWAQFLASRGYLVFQPNFRGSGGYGRKWLEAGWGQWGGLMQDDIVDGVKALIAAGRADPSRICIFGGSYGGYAALIQGALHGDMYRCVVSWAGISDLQGQLRHEREVDGKDGYVFTYDSRSIGRMDADKDRLARDSAITYAASYGPPVLLIHGEEDANVPPDQSREMDSALRRAHKDVRLMMFKGEDHTGWANENEAKALDAVSDFIAAHIGPTTATAPAAPPSTGAPARTAGG